jgi:hypothetical protein
MRTASGSEPHRLIKDRYPYFCAWAQERQRNRATHPDTRPGEDLAVLRDVALAGGRRWDRERVIPKVQHQTINFARYFIFPVVKSRGFLIFFIKSI